MEQSVFLLVALSNFGFGLCAITVVEPACVVGDIIQNNRTKCMCIDRSIYECFTITNGTKITGYTNQITNNESKLNKITDDSNKVPSFKSSANVDISSTSSCIPDAIYVQGNTTCVCTRKGTWPHKACFDLFGVLLVKPKNYTKCTPNSYVVVDCNICYCNSKGIIDTVRCTKKDCSKGVIKLTRKNFENNCVPKTWYSLSACQFCYCAEANKLVCNTGRYNAKRLELGTYNLTVCGAKFLEEAMELMPDEQRLRNAAAETKPVNPLKLEVNKIEPVKMREKPVKLIKYTTTKKVKLSRVTTTTEKPKDEEYYSESEEVTTYKYSTLKKVLTSTPQLSENEDNLPSYDLHNENTKNKKRGSQDSYDKNSMQEDDPAYKDQYVDTVTENTRYHNAHPKSKNFDTNDDAVQYGGKNKTEPMLTINIPNMISKVFNLRRSKGNATVILRENKETACKPGVMTFEGCNKCFCLKSGKMLCTDEKC